MAANGGHNCLDRGSDSDSRLDSATAIVSHRAFLPHPELLQHLAYHGVLVRTTWHPPHLALDVAKFLRLEGKDLDLRMTSEAPPSWVSLNAEG